MRALVGFPPLPCFYILVCLDLVKWLPQCECVCSVCAIRRTYTIVVWSALKITIIAILIILIIIIITPSARVNSHHVLSMRLHFIVPEKKEEEDCPRKDVGLPLNDHRPI